MKLISVIVATCVLGAVFGLDDFLDCPGNDNILGLFRRCCTSDEMPNGCECFDISSSTPFTNSAFHKPECPDNLGVKFILYNNDYAAGQVIKYGASSHFNPTYPVRVVAHGFTDSGFAPWMVEMKDEFLKNSKYNVILVDWQKAAAGPNYPQAAANTRSVGAMIARLVQHLHQSGAPYGNFHMIGHSLGAQIMGYAGKEIKRLDGASLGRISGLDPAGPLFESYGPVVRVDAADADMVDIMHTDAEAVVDAGFGTRYSIGDVDFYPNGGKHQPGCPAETYGLLSMISFEDEKDGGACSHGRAVDFFTNSINKCRYNPPTGGSGCTMGYHTSVACRGDHYPTTTDTAPYC